ncbi:hypothetical protein [uncultured Lacinutrix sp.]|uniref:hypothetical protein n=1 Tax=uncultured Lacinutrix sp. TaxID=574032 RepID=UPI002632B349|nr:hypothetical protein [uncultured Lacinutrix sp.]
MILKVYLTRLIVIFINFAIMKNKNIISYLSIIFGGAIAIYANAETEQNVWLLILGIAFLMFGGFRLNAKIPSKTIKSEKENYFTGEEE